MLLRVQAQGVIDRRVVANTRKHYDGHIRKLTTWLKQSHPNLVEEISTSSSSTAPASNLRIKLPLQAQVILNYLVSTQRKGNGKLVATSTMTGIGSAINDMYRSRGLQISEQIKAKLNQFMAGHRRMVADAKQQGQLPMFEGKRPLSHTGYLNLAKYALKTQSSRVGSLFPHTFIVLAWNLFARSHSVAALMLNHFEWKDDALMVTVPKHKGDQEGARIYPLHVYANPIQPEICSILALAIHVICIQYHHTGSVDEEGTRGWKLFGGSNMEGRFSNWLQDSMKTGLFTEADIGADPSAIGTHSFRYANTIILFFL